MTGCDTNPIDTHRFIDSVEGGVVKVSIIWPCSFRKLCCRLAMSLSSFSLMEAARAVLSTVGTAGTDDSIGTSTFTTPSAERGEGCYKTFVIRDRRFQ